MRSIVLPVVLVIALTGAVPFHSKIKSSGPDSDVGSGLESPESGSYTGRDTPGSNLVSIEGILSIQDGTMLVESEGITCIVRSPATETTATRAGNDSMTGADVITEGKVRIEGLPVDRGGNGGTLLLTPARLSFVEPA